MNTIDLVIFDCDGVLVDSEIIGIEIATELLHTAGYDISVPVFTQRFCGMSWTDILLTLEHETGLSLMSSLFDRAEQELDLRIPQRVEAIRL